MEKKTTERLECLIERADKAMEKFDPNKIIRVIDLEEDWPREVALEHGIPVGTIACPHCGLVSSGAIEPVCPMCERVYWEEI